MIDKTRTKTLGILLSLALVLGLLPGMGLTAYAAGTELTAEPTEWAEGSYEVPAGGLTVGHDVTVSGDVTLTIPSGVTLTINGNGSDSSSGAIIISAGKTLTVTGGGTLEVYGKNNDSGGEKAIKGPGTLSVENATVNATGGDNLGGSGSGGYGISDSTLTVTGGTVNAKGGNGYSAGVGGNAGGGFYNCSITVNGGTVNATGGNGGNSTSNSSDWNKPADGGAGIYSGSVTVNSGTLMATGGSKGTGPVGSNVSSPNDGKGIYSATISAGDATESDDGSDSSWAAVSDSPTKRYVKVTAAAAAPTTSTYTLTIPATLTVANPGWNATDGISATGTLADGKKLTVTASSDGEFALVSGENKVNYKLAESGDANTTYANATEKTSCAPRQPPREQLYKRDVLCLRFRGVGRHLHLHAVLLHLLRHHHENADPYRHV